VRKHEDYSVTN